MHCALRARAPIGDDPEVGGGADGNLDYLFTFEASGAANFAGSTLTGGYQNVNSFLPSGDPFANPEAFSFSFSAQAGRELADATFEGAQVRWTGAMTGSAEAVQPVPEAGAMLLLGIGLLASAGLFRRRLFVR